MEQVMSALHDLLTEVAQTGHLPTEGQIGTVFRHGSSSERDGAGNGIRAAARRIAAIKRGDTDSDDHDADIAELIEDTTERFQHLTGEAADKPGGSRDLAAQIAKRQAEGVVGREKRSARAATNRKTREPLQELLAAATSGRAVKRSDLDELPVREDLSDGESADFYAGVHAAGNRIQQLRAVGNYASADRVAEETTLRLGGALAEPDNSDPNAHLTDPRELADAIRGTARDRGRAI
jgi:hypothetical protein